VILWREASRSNCDIWRKLGFSHVFWCLHRYVDWGEHDCSCLASPGPVSLRSPQPHPVLYSCNPSANHYDESESPEVKDRLRSQHDYQVNLKAELEIRHLHDIIDHLLSHLWDRLAQIQEIQLDLLSETGKRE